MRGSSSLFLLLVVVGLLLAGCGGGSSTGSFAIPASIILVPAGNVSLELGRVQALTVQLNDATGKAIAEPVNFVSSNPAVATVASNGAICAGSWNSLSAPTICTPGPVGVADISATAQGVTSAPVTVYVHQHIDNIVASVLPANPPSTAPCISKGLTANYQAKAFSGTTDITSTVGPFNWTPLNVQVITLNTSAEGLQSGQVQVTGNVPGTTKLFAGISATNSLPIDVETCPVESISLSVSGTLSSSGSGTLVPKIVDSQGVTITGVPLTWCSSNEAAVGVGGSGNCNTTNSTSLGVTGTGNGGTAAITASCTPANCNIGFTPSLPIYSKNVIVTTSQATAAPTEIVWVTSTGCGTTDGCLTTVYPIAIPNNVVGSPVLLPATPNSFVFDSTGAMFFLGTDQGLQGTRGLMQVTTTTATPTVAQFPAVVGKVLAVSGDTTKVIVSDTISTPNQVYVFDVGTSTPAVFQITGATAAAFSPDSLKAYIIAGDTLYVYSKQDALQTIPLSGTATDVSFLPEGAFAYLAGGAPGALSTVYRTCDNSIADTVPLASAAPTMLRTLTNSTQVFAVDSPNVDLFSVSTSPVGCQPSVTDDNVKTFNLGQGKFTAKRLLISSDSSRAYIVATGLNSVLVFNIGSQTSTAIPLAGSGVTALDAALNAAGNLLYVTGSDSLVHVLNTQVDTDVSQIALPLSVCVGSGNITFPCTPDLIALQP